MKLVALIVFIVLAVATAVLLLTWRKKKKAATERQTVEMLPVKELPEKEPAAKNEIVSGTYYLIHQVFINEIQYTAKSEIPSEHLKSIAKELEIIKSNETPYAATSMGNLTLQFSDGKSVEIETIYNMGRNRYDPIIYLEGKQYYISETFRNTIQQLSQLD